MTAEPIRVLIADDDKVVRWALKMLLADANGIAVTAEASGGREAVALVEKLRPHVVLIGCTLPDPRLPRGRTAREV